MNPEQLKLLQQLMQQKASQKYQTNLNPIEQLGFAKWAGQNNVPVDLSPKSDYDMTGFYKNLESNPETQPQISNIDNQLHFTDKFKTPLHETFSNESKYSDKTSPHWEGNSLKNPDESLNAMELPGGEIAKIEALKRMKERK